MNCTSLLIFGIFLVASGYGFQMKIADINRYWDIEKEVITNENEREKKHDNEIMIEKKFDEINNLHNKYLNEEDQSEYFETFVKKGLQKLYVDHVKMLN